MQIFVKTLTGKTITLQVESSDNVKEVKAKLEDKEGIPSCQQTLLNGNKILEGDNKPISSYGVSNEATLQMLLRWNCSIKIENIPKSTLKLIHKDHDNVAEETRNNNDDNEQNEDNDACLKFQDKLVRSMTFEMNREVETKTKSFRKLEEQRIEIDMKVSELKIKRDRNMLEYEERKERQIKYRGALWEDHYDARKKKSLLDKKIKEMQDESINLELKIKEKTKKRKDAIEEHVLDTRETDAKNNKLEEEIGILKRKRVHIENEKNDLFKKKKVNEGLVDFISNTIEEKIKDLECPVCFETAETPIYMCSMAHLICKNCLPRLKICPECRKHYSKSPVRHRFAEKLDEEIKKLSIERKTILDGV